MDTLRETDAQTSFDAEQAPELPPSGEKATKAQNVAGLFSNRKTRNVIFATLGLLGVAGVLIVMSVSSGNQPKEIPKEMKGVNTLEPPTSMSKDGLAKDSPRFNEMAQNIDQAKSAAAEKMGESYQPAATSAYQYAPTNAPTANPGMDQSAQMTPQQAEAYRARQEQIIADARARGTEAATRNINLWDKIRGPKMMAYDGQIPASGQGSVAATNPGGAANPAQGAAATTANQNQAITLVTAGTRGIISLDLALTSDEPNAPAVGTILMGPYKDAQLIGRFVKNQGNTIQATFVTMSIPQTNVSVPIQAVSFNLDSDTQQGIATDVDHHILEKYVLKPGAQAISAVGKVLSQPTTVVTLNSTTTQQPNLSNRDLWGIAAGAGAAQYAQDISALSVENTVKVKSKTLVGVLFTQDVVYQKPATAVAPKAN